MTVFAQIWGFAEDVKGWCSCAQSLGKGCGVVESFVFTRGQRGVVLGSGSC